MFTFPASRCEIIPLLASSASANVVLPSRTQWINIKTHILQQLWRNINNVLIHLLIHKTKFKALVTVYRHSVYRITEYASMYIVQVALRIDNMERLHLRYCSTFMTIYQIRMQVSEVGFEPVYTVLLHDSPVSYPLGHHAVW